jgi:hypothetical protein
MPLDTSALKVPDPKFPGIKERIVTLIRITATAVTQASTVGDKRAMLRTAAADDTFIAVWTGMMSYESEVFGVPDALLARWKQELA